MSKLNLQAVKCIIWSQQHSNSQLRTSADFSGCFRLLHSLSSLLSPRSSSLRLLAAHFPSQTLLSLYLPPPSLQCKIQYVAFTPHGLYCSSHDPSQNPSVSTCLSCLNLLHLNSSPQDIWYILFSLCTFKAVYSSMFYSTFCLFLLQYF